MSARAINQNNVLAGTFVIAGVLLAVTLSFILGDIAGKFGDKTTYTVRFPTTVGVTGLQPGAEVTFAGMSVGTVKSVEMHLKSGSPSDPAIPEAMDVHIQLDANLVLYEDAIADLAPPILGGVSKINIASAGTGPTEWSDDPGGILNEGEILQGRFAPSILRQIGFTAEETQKILDMIDKFPTWSANITDTTQNVADTTERISRMTEKLEPDFNSGVDDGRATIENIKLFTDKLHGDEGWSSKVDSIMTSVDDASANINPALEEARTTISTAREVIDENRGKVGRILDNVEQSTESVRFETIDKANALLADGSLALGSFKDTLGEVQDAVAENKSNIGATMVNARQISLQGKLFLEEIRAQPWRLLNKPSKKDLEREPLYEAARAYAGAVADLRTASESLDTAVRTQGGNAISGADELATELLRLASVVEQAYGRYETAERGLLSLLAQSP